MATRAAAPTQTAPKISGPTMGMPGTTAVTAKAAHENFPVASLLLPPSLRRPLLGIYGFARLTDDIGDEAEGDRSALLDWLESDVGRMYDGEPIHPLLRRLAPSVRELGLPRRPFLRLIEANRQDQKVSRYETYADLAAYCELAEHWQDVGEDFRRGRVYLPQEDLTAFGVPEEDLGAVSPSERFRRLMAFEVARARGLLEQGGELVRSLGGWARLAVAGYVAGGKAALAAIERNSFEVLGEPPKATRVSRAAAYGRELGGSL